LAKIGGSREIAEIAGIADIARDRKNKTCHGDTEARREAKSLPQISADERGPDKTSPSDDTDRTELLVRKT
jgi:hypothetical protein